MWPFITPPAPSFPQGRVGGLLMQQSEVDRTVQVTGNLHHLLHIITIPGLDHGNTVVRLSPDAPLRWSNSCAAYAGHA